MRKDQITVDRAQGRDALERVLTSRVFAKADRSRRFLKYLFDSAMAQPPITTKEYTIALDVFDRDAGYDPSIDATVRVEASRLRTRLREYYVDEGKGDPIVIEVPKGSYQAVLHDRAATEDKAPLSSSSALEGQAFPEPHPEPTTSAKVAGRTRRWWAVPLAVASALCLLLVATLAVLRNHKAVSAGPDSPVRLPARSVAILPIENRTADPAFDLLCDGLTDDLIRQLSQVPKARVISRNAVFRFKPASTNPLEVGRSLGVETVLTAKLQRVGEHTALLAELSDVDRGTVLLDREYILEGTDFGPVQAELQRDLLSQLHLELSALDPGRTLPNVSSSPEAYREFLKGDALARNGEPGDLHHAIEHFERAVLLDPHFDLAWSAMASADLYLGLYFDAPRDYMPKARRFAERALEINPSLGEAHGSLGLIHLVYDWVPSAAAAEMTAAGSQEAAISTLACTAHLIGEAGKPRNAEEMLTSMLTYDPNSASLVGELGCVAYYKGDYDAALRHYRQALAADPRSPTAYWGAGKTLNAERKYAEALAVLSLFQQRNGFEPPLLSAERGYAVGRAGRRQEASAVAQTLIAAMKDKYVDPYFVAVIYNGMDDREQAFAWLNKAFQVRSPFMIALTSEPKWDRWRSDPRFVATITRMQTSPAKG